MHSVEEEPPDTVQTLVVMSTAQGDPNRQQYIRRRRVGRVVEGRGT